MSDCVVELEVATEAYHDAHDQLSRVLNAAEINEVLVTIEELLDGCNQSHSRIAVGLHGISCVDDRSFRNNIGDDSSVSNMIGDDTSTEVGDDR